MPAIIDISPVVSERIAVWPGDVPYRRTPSMRLEDGAPYALSSIEATAHLGAHVDAPCHFTRGGAGVAEQPLDLYLGPCQIIEVSPPPGARVTPAHIPRGTRITAPRVLFKTDSFPDPDRFDEGYAGLSPELVGLVAAEGGRLVGIDTPSIDPFDSEDFPAHTAAARHGIAVLEGLVLAHVQPGEYTLIALPLRLEGADASPVRAVLLPL